jgi:ketosteroid isomerase-like protein
MAQENVGAVQRALDAFASRDKAAWRELTDSNVEAVPVGDWPEGPIRGQDAVWYFLLESDEPWQPGPYEVTDAVEGDRAVAVRLQRRLRGKSSGIEVDYDYWAVFTFRDGKLGRAEWFGARSDALEAAGLAE